MDVAWVGAWLWRRHRRRFVVLLWIIAATSLATSLIGPATVVGAMFLDLRAGETVLWATSAAGSVVVTAMVVFAAMTRSTAPIRRFAAGDESDPHAAWLALVRHPQELGLHTLVVLLPISLVMSLPVVLHYAAPGTEGLVALLWAYVVVTVAGVALLTTGVQLLVSGPAGELSAELGVVDVPTRSGWTIRRRLVVASFVCTTFGGVATAAAVLGTAASESDYLVAFAGVTLFNAYVLALLDNAIFRPTVAPVETLIDAAVRVRRGDLSTAVPVATLDEMGELAAAFNEMQSGLRDRGALHAAFGSYVDPVLAERLLTSGSPIFEGEELDVTVLFLDVRGFTAFSEGVAPGEAVAVLNGLFDLVVPILRDRGGHANHYLGDGLLAVFGAPAPLEGHADAAVAAAVDIQRAVRRQLDAGLRLGIGINTGPVIAGTVGGGGHHEFTVIGDTVNVAARVEQLTKETGDPILITEATWRALSTPRRRSAKRGAFEVRGKAEAVTVRAVDPSTRVVAAAR